eukprot:scaffold10818_cov21-Tisochrysis_lutea.AAC.3
MPTLLTGCCIHNFIIGVLLTRIPVCLPEMMESRKVSHRLQLRPGSIHSMRGLPVIFQTVCCCSTFRQFFLQLIKIKLSSPTG